MSDVQPDRVVDITIHGLVNVGKSSLINALAGHSPREVGATAGTTTEVAAQPWRVVDTKIGPFAVRLIDTPGLEEIGDEGRDAEARDAARAAELIVFVTDEDLTASGFEAIRRLRAWGKPLIVAWNKVDQFGEIERGEILESLRDRLSGLIPSEAIVAVAAAPLLRRRLRLPDGTSRIEVGRGAPEIEDLQVALADAILDPELFVGLAGASRQVEAFVQERAANIEDRRKRAERVADETSLGLALALAINPLPLVDLLTAPTGIGILIRRLARVYGVALDADSIRRLSMDLIRGGRVVMWGSLLGAGAGGLLKIVPGLGHLAGALAEGACAGLFSHVLGRSLIEYFEAGCDWGDAGLVATLDRIAAHTDRRAVTRGLVAELKARLRDRRARPENRP